MKAACFRITAVMLWCCACAFTMGRKNQPCLPYEPATIALRGTLQIVPRFGPPNYGENPESDQKLDIPMLELVGGIDVCGDSTSDINHDSFTDLREIQVLFPPGTRYANFRDREVLVEGTLSQAVMSHHFTPVVMVVRVIRLADSQATPS